MRYNNMCVKDKHMPAHTGPTGKRVGSWSAVIGYRKWVRLNPNSHNRR